jgi:protein O-mannosyl-transferase
MLKAFTNKYYNNIYYYIYNYIYNYFYIILIFAATFLTHWPAVSGGFIWDDDAHVTRLDLTNLEGLKRIWIQLGATQQYYPLLHSFFWLQNQIWGNNSVYYHITNIILHAIFCILLVRFLQLLNIKGSYLVGIIVAIHPVYVETVAWITEEKNTLSSVFYIICAIHYIKFDKDRRMDNYISALLYFILALLCKTVTATFPAAILLIIWWQRGYLKFKTDLIPTIPFWIFGASAGLFTAWVEKHIIGAQGADFQLTLIERILLAGRVIIFYIGKILYPVNFIFIYPHWDIKQDNIILYINIIFLFILIYLLYKYAIKGNSYDRFTRTPLVGLLYFIGTLFPVLGFFNVYPFMFSYVADHFQYLASIGIIVLVVNIFVYIYDLVSENYKVIINVLLGISLALLSVASYERSTHFISAEELYNETIRQNPNAWMCRNNLGAILLNRGDIYGALAQFEEAIKIRPAYADAQSNLANVFLRIGKLKEAIEHGEISCQLRPNGAENENNLAIAYASIGDYRNAILHYNKSISSRPNYVEPYNNLGNCYKSMGNYDEALKYYKFALNIKPDFHDTYANMGQMYQVLGKFNEARLCYSNAIKLAPNLWQYHNGLALALASLGYKDQAIKEFKYSLDLNPKNADQYINLAYYKIGNAEYDEAKNLLNTALLLQPSNYGAENNLGAVYFKLDNVLEAIKHYNRAIAINPDFAEAHNNLGVALSKLNRFEDATYEYHQAISINSKYTEAMGNLYLSELRSKHINEALDAINAALKLEPNNPVLQKYKTDISNNRN